MSLIIIPSFVPAERLQWSMIMLGLYLLYRVFAIETLVVQDLQFKTRYNFFLGITYVIGTSLITTTKVMLKFGAIWIDSVSSHAL